MAKKKPKEPTSMTKRQLQAFAKRWRSALKAHQKSGGTHLRLAQKLYDIAVESDGSELLLSDRPSGNPKAKPKLTRYKLTDPRAALVNMLRFCNIWLPLPFAACIAVGCPPVFIRGRFICFLMGCAIGVCPPKLGVVRCMYLCIRFR